MSKKIKVIVYSGDEALHANQVFVAFGRLYRLGLIDIEFKRSSSKIALKPFVECIIDNKKVIFDLHDNAGYIDQYQYEWCDHYFKRSVHKELLDKYAKVIPWGLNFYITSKNDFSYRRAFYNPFPAKKISLLLRGNKIASALLNIKNSSNTVDEMNFFRMPGKTFKREIIFSPRLWDPGRVNGSKKEERFLINDQRIKFVRALRKNFPEYYNGGIEDTEHARKICPELILLQKTTHKSNYLNQLQQASIGLSTPGLAGSIGWKLSEYVAFARAVVSNDLDDHILNGAFAKGKNYLPYHDEPEMLAAMEKLLLDEALCFKMMQNNYVFSQEYLLSEMQMKSALKKIAVDLSVNTQ